MESFSPKSKEQNKDAAFNTSIQCYTESSGQAIKE